MTPNFGVSRLIASRGLRTGGAAPGVDSFTKASNRRARRLSSSRHTSSRTCLIELSLAVEALHDACKAAVASSVAFDWDRLLRGAGFASRTGLVFCCRSRVIRSWSGLLRTTSRCDARLVGGLSQRSKRTRSTCAVRWEPLAPFHNATMAWKDIETTGSTSASQSCS